jgi:hypothetical protein
VFRRLIHSLLLTAFLLAGPVMAQSGDDEFISREFQIKTAYLFHFVELTEWPDAGDVSICLRGRSQISQFLPALEGRTNDGHLVHVKLLADDSKDNCQIMFLSSSEVLTPSLLEQIKAEHILLVGDGENFARNGGMLQFTLRDNKVKLLVNLSSVKAAGLKLSSKLLRLAEIVE